jgi:hypothetical protein
MALEGVEGSQSRPGRSLPPGKVRYPLYRRLGGPQGRSGQVRKIPTPPRFDPRTVQPVASRYTDYATRPNCFNKNKVITQIYRLDDIRLVPRVGPDRAATNKYSPISKNRPAILQFVPHIYGALRKRFIQLVLWYERAVCFPSFCICYTTVALLSCSLPSRRQISPAQVFDLRTVQLVASRYTDWATWPKFPFLAWL